MSEMDIMDSDKYVSPVPNCTTKGHKQPEEGWPSKDSGKRLTVFIDPGMACRKMPLSHWACVQPNATHAFADGTTLIRRPLMVSFKVDQSEPEG